ncbi:MAG: TetR family transcriptional regulator [Spirochaetales bacterium]|nr:TetR family transcriptional regulator [Spirochaetales bacterium]
MNFERARSREHKEERREEIMKAARDLLDTRDYEKITLTAIARELSFTRANLYKYVSSRDEIFLWIILEDVSAWIDDVLASFEGKISYSTAEIALLWAQVFCRHARVVKLFSLMYAVIERNVPVTVLADFKKNLFQTLIPLNELLGRILPKISEKGRWEFLTMQLHYAAGLYPAVDVTERQREAMRLAGVELDIPDFQSGMTRFLTLLLEGLT